MRKFFTDVIKKIKGVHFLVLIGLVIPLLLPLFRPGFFPTQDYIYVGRIYEMNRALKDGQFPVRWAPDFRYGEPLFNFYAPLPYYIGSFVHDFGLSYLDTVKVLLSLSFILSAITMYLLTKEIFGKMGAFISALIYVYAPYRSVDVYVRGAISEAWSFIFFPLIFLGVLNLSRRVSARGIAFLALSLAGLFFTHNIMTVLFIPFAVGWMLFWVWKKRQLYLGVILLISLVLGIGLSATFLLPAFLEKDLVQSKYLLNGYFDFRGHFVAIPQLFSTFWGYGASLWGSKDDMSFQIGLVHWFGLLLTGALVVLRHKVREYGLLLSFLFVSFLFSLFMMHNRSAPIWELFSILAFVQFPWRFLGVSVFLIALISGFVGLNLNKRMGWVSLLFIAAVVVGNIGYFHPESYYDDSVDEHYMSADILSRDDKLPKDYLPIWVKKIREEKINSPYPVSGDIKISNFTKNSASANFKVNVLKEGEVEVPITYFPGWEVFVNGQLISQSAPSQLGLVNFRLPKGEHSVSLIFGDTPIRTVGNWLSGLSLIIVALLFITSKVHLKWIR